MITSKASVSSKNEQLQIVPDSGERHSIPIEDINSIMIESKEVQISSNALQKLALNGTATFLCDKQHMPCGVIIPFNTHSRKLKILNNQLCIKKPLHKRLWQQIVQQKIINQADCLCFCGKEGYLELNNLYKKVKSGDSTYIESQAAAKYFRLLFGNEFRRYSKKSKNDTDIINSALNYGYAVLRGAIARTLVIYGFEPSMGIHHHSETNRFNLADDLLEPYRPIVDLFTYENIKGDKLTPQHKQGLYEILNYEMLSAGERNSIAYSIERMVKSLSAIYQDNCGQLTLPTLCPLKIHTYE